MIIHLDIDKTTITERQNVIDYCIDQGIRFSEPGPFEHYSESLLHELRCDAGGLISGDNTPETVYAASEFVRQQIISGDVTTDDFEWLVRDSMEGALATYKLFSDEEANQELYEFVRDIKSNLIEPAEVHGNRSHYDNGGNLIATVSNDVIWSISQKDFARTLELDIVSAELGVTL